MEKGNTWWQYLILGLQHQLTMFSQTVLVPILCGIPISTALLASGIGTLIFHLVTKLKVPVYLGSSFAFIQPINQVILYYQGGQERFSSVPEQLQNGLQITPEQIQYATGGILMQGIQQLILVAIIHFIGLEKVIKLFPPVISGTMIILIGLTLSPTAISMASSNWLLQISQLQIQILCNLYLKGFPKIISIILGILGGYQIQQIFGQVNFQGITQQQVVGIPQIILPKFSVYQATLIVPIMLATSIEHFGDIFQISSITGKELYKDPGIVRTMLGDQIQDIFQGFIGGPSTTTYSENTGVLAITKVFNPVVMRIQQVFAILMQFIPKIQQFLYSIPTQVLGGIMILLFGSIQSVGIKTLVENKVQVDGKNLIIISIMLVIGIGGATISLGNQVFQGLGLQALIGLLLNQFFMLTKRQ